MATIKAALQRVADRITGRRADLAKSRRRHKVWREATERQHDKQIRAEDHGHPLRAGHFKRLAERSQLKSRFWKERVRRDDAALPKLEAVESKVQAELDQWIRDHGARLVGENKVRGGTFEERAFLAQATGMKNYEAGTQPGYYSQTGAARSYNHTLNNYPQGHVWDCSTYRDGIAYVCGEASPSGPDGYTLGGYTGTEMEYGTKVTESKLRVGDAVIYLRYPGDTIGHHVEVVFDVEKKQTTGHGDSAINIGCNGSWDLFGDGLYALVRGPRKSTKEV